VTERKYRLFVPRTDDGKEAVVTGGEVLIEIADVVGTNLVRTQRRVAVETLVRTHFPEGISACRSLEMVQLAPQDRADSSPCHISQGQAEPVTRSAGSERSNTP
jgi:hypothetical protein